MPPPKRFTSHEISRIADLRYAGHSYAEIAEAVGSNVSTIKWVCLNECLEPEKPGPVKPVPTELIIILRNGYQVRRYTQEEDARLIEMERRGLSLAETGRILHRKPNSVRGRLMILARRDEREEIDD